MEGITITRYHAGYDVADEALDDGISIPDSWDDGDVREMAEQHRRQAAWYDAALRARAGEEEP